MTRCNVLRLLVLAGLLWSAAGAALPARAQDTATLVIESTPEAAALYLGDLAYLRDELTLPGEMAARILLPPTTRRESIVISEGESRLAHYRVTTAESGQVAVSVPAAPGDAPRALTLTYLASGAGWTPRYDLDVLAPEQVALGFSAAITNHSLPLNDVDLRLVAGMPGADANYRPAMTVTQMNTLYSEPDQGSTGGGPVAINHVYPIGEQSLLPGETLYWTLFDDTLPARRLIVWDARFGQRTEVITKVTNSSDIPFVEGRVNAYQDGLFVGEDAIEWTPTGGEGNVTIGGLSTIRVRRTKSVSEIGTFRDDRYRHEVTLSITNHGDEAISLTVLDEWNRAGQSFEFSQEPTRQGNNVLRWEPTIPAGETLEITISFIID